MAKKRTKKYTRKTKFSELIKDERAVEILMKEGMGCVGCVFAQVETLEQGCISHGVDVDKILKKLNSNQKNER